MQSKAERKKLAQAADQFLKQHGCTVKGTTKKAQKKTDNRMYNTQLHKDVSRLERKWDNPYESQEYLWTKATQMLANVKSRAKQKRLKFDLDFEWILERLRAGRCEVTGISWNANGSKRKNNRSWGATIDRIDSDRGYTKGNCQMVCWLYNRSKGAGTHRDVLKMAFALCRKVPEKDFEEIRRIHEKTTHFDRSDHPTHHS